MFGRGHPETERESAVPVVGEDPVGRGSEERSGGRSDRLMAGGADLEEGLVLPLSG